MQIKPVDEFANRGSFGIDSLFFAGVKQEHNV
jgi:hypothetical protein